MSDDTWSNQNDNYNNLNINNDEFIDKLAEIMAEYTKNPEIEHETFQDRYPIFCSVFMNDNNYSHHEIYQNSSNLGSNDFNIIDMLSKMTIS